MLASSKAVRATARAVEEDKDREAAVATTVEAVMILGVCRKAEEERNRAVVEVRMVAVQRNKRMVFLIRCLVSLHVRIVGCARFRKPFYETVRMASSVVLHESDDRR